MICLPVEANGPVIGRIRPILNGPVRLGSGRQRAQRGGAGECPAARGGG